MNISSILPPRSWRRRLVFVAAMLLALYAVAGFFIIPAIARPRLETMLSELVGMPVKIGSVSFNPFDLSASVRKVELDDGGSPVIAFEELYADVRALSLLRLDVALDSVHLQAPDVRLVLDKEGNVNLVQLFAADDAAPEPMLAAAEENAGLFPVSISTISIDAGRLHFRDEAQAQPFELELQPLRLELHDFSTQKDHAGRYVLSAKTGEDGTIDWTGNLTIDPLRADGEITLVNLRARTLAQYLGDLLRFDVKEGQIGLSTAFVFDGSGDESKIALGPGDLDVEALELREGPEGPAFLTLPQLRIGGISIDFDKSSISAATVSSSKARLNVWLDAKGAMGPPALFGDPSTPAAESAPAASEAGPGWAVAVGDIRIDDYGVAFEDRSFTEPVVFTVEPIDARVEKLSLAEGTNATIGVELGLPDNGSLKASGSAVLSPLAVELDVQLAGVGLDRFQAYIGRAAHINVESGKAAADGRLRVYAGDGGRTVIEYAGKAGVQELSVTDTIRSEDLIKWAALQLNEIAYTSQPAKLQIKQALVEQPYVRILIGKDGKLNLSELAVQPGAEDAEESKPAAVAEAASEPPMAIAIDRLEISDGLTDFADQSIQPNVATGIHNLNGEVLGLSSDPAAKSKIRLGGKVDKHSPAKISGTINPFNPAMQTDVTVSFDNVSLTIFTPYSARFAGYKIKRGKASIDLSYHVEGGRLKAENQIILDKLTLGERVQSSEATSLPVALAIALLKDRNGRININLPMSGDLDDPKFSYTSLFTTTLLDLIAKTVASPFSIVGSLANFDSDELEYVAFAPGSAVLDEAEGKKLDAISEALKERPALRLEVSGGVDPNADATGLAAAELTKALKRAKKAELKAEGEVVPKKLAEIELAAADYERLFAERYEEVFATKAPRDAQGAITGAARRALTDSFTIDEDGLRALAKKRAAAVQDRIIGNGIENDRIYLLESDLQRRQEQGEVRSELSLTS